MKIAPLIHQFRRENISKYRLMEKLKKEKVILSKPMGYLAFLSLMFGSKLILTDSGGIQ